MIIDITYEGKWSNSFLDDPKPRNEKGETPPRNYIATTSTLKSDPDAYRFRDITLNTIYGVLYRLVGARKALDLMLEEDTSLIKTIISEGRISFRHTPTSITKEIVYLRNAKNEPAQAEYAGVPDVSFLADEDLSSIFEVADYTQEELVRFISRQERPDRELEGAVKCLFDLNFALSTSKDRMVADSPYRPVTTDEKKKKAKLKKYIISYADPDILEGISSAYEEITNTRLEPKSNILIAAVNLATIEYVQKNPDTGLKKMLQNALPVFKGCGKNAKAFTVRDFLTPTTGYKKIQFGNPYRVEGINGKPDIWLTKMDGNVEIKIDCTMEEARELDKMIDYAGVGPFYIGKKGLAYITKIIL